MANKPKKKQAAARKAAPKQDTDLGKRASISTIRYWAIGAAVVGGGGYWFANDVQATMREHNLSRLGQGVPTVVQIHDPSYPQCTALQRTAHSAMSGFDETELVFLVANINTEEGRAIATANGVGNVTLVLFDGEGRRREIIHGPSTKAQLEAAFANHLQRLAGS